MLKKGMRPSHPGSLLRGIIEGLREETGEGLTIKEIATGLGVTPKTLSLILNERQGISSEMAIRISEAFGTSAKFWLDVQRNYDLWFAEKSIKRGSIRHFITERSSLIPAAN